MMGIHRFGEPVVGTFREAIFQRAPAISPDRIGMFRHA